MYSDVELEADGFTPSPASDPTSDAEPETLVAPAVCYEEIEGEIRIVAPHVAIDTEGYATNPWGLSFAVAPGHARVIRRAHGRLILDPDTLVILHNSLHDLRVLRKLGVEPAKYTDTMLMAWLLGYEFIGLKWLSGQLLMKSRESYRDVMEEANERIAREWLQATVEQFPRWPGAKPPDLEKTLRLVDRMLKKDGTRPLRERWRDCRAREVLEKELKLVEPMPEATMDDLSREDAIQYAGEDADDTLQIFPTLDTRIDQMGLRDVLNVDLAVVPMIDRMQEIGIEADPQYFRDLSQLWAIELENLRADIAAMGGPENPGSAPQVGEWLFGKLRLPNRKRTATGDWSTDKKVLESLVKNKRVQGEQRRALELLMEWRQVEKLKGTYADPMPGFINPLTGRLHPNLSMTKVPTGRLAASEPNVLAFPKHSDRGKLIRGGFRAANGCLLGEWDLDQIEMRVMAIDSMDQQMILEFLSGVDKHTSTGAMIFGVKVDELICELESKDKGIKAKAKDKRFAAKAVNFGILMGITEFGLCDQFAKNGSVKSVEERWNPITEEIEIVESPWKEDDCRLLLKEWHRIYPDASSYIYAKHAEARRFGYVRDMWGRLRLIPDIHSENEYFRQEALRQAQATPIQSGAQGIVKRWMIEVWRALPDHWRRGIRNECLLQVHDALMFEFQEDAYEEVNRLALGALEAFERTQQFPIPITAKGDIGRHWADL